MGTLRTSTSLSTYVGIPLSASAYTLNEDGTRDKSKRNSTLITTTTSSATVAGEYILNQRGIRRAQDKLTSSYIESLSDEELAQALEQLNLLDSDNNEKKDCKTI